MIHGVCCGRNGIAAASEARLSYIEPALVQVRGYSDDQLDEMRGSALAAGVPAEGFNCFFGGEIMLYETDPGVILEYAKRNFEVVKRLGGRYCVIGSGRSRSVPEGKDREAAFESFCKTVSEIGRLAGEYGVELYLEPLQRAETNFMNTLTDGVTVCRRIGMDNVGVLLDLYHFYKNGEELSELDCLRPGELRHVHIARPNADRGYLRKEDSETLAAWAEKLKSTGYDGRISLECTWGADFASEVRTAAGMLEFF